MSDLRIIKEFWVLGNSAGTFAVKSLISIREV